MDVVAARATACESDTGTRWAGVAWPVLAGAVGASLLAAFYLATITFAQDWDHTHDQLQADRWFVSAISAGFGLQVGMFVYLRMLHARSRAGAMAASTGTSSVAMLACCAHHLADALPLIGLSGAAVFLNDYRAPILWMGIGMNGAGIAYLAWKIAAARSGLALHRGA